MAIFNLSGKTKELPKEPPLSINKEEAARRILNGSPVIDVRTIEEHKSRRIPNSISIPLQELKLKYKVLSKDPVYIVVCETGERSTQATRFLRNLGYKAYNLSTGLISYTGKIEHDNNTFLPLDKSELPLHK